MSPPLEQDYIGLSETTSLVERSSDKISASSSSSSSSSSNTLCSAEDEKRNVLNLKETELRLGLPGSHSPERKTTSCGLSLFGQDFEDKTNGFSLASAKISVSGAKRGFSDAINGSAKWVFGMTGGSNADFAKVDSPFTPSAGDAGGKSINTLQSCLPGATAKEVGAPSAAKPAQDKSASPEKEPGSAPASKAQVVGWPPIRAFRKNTLATNSSKNNDVEGKPDSSCLYVKVSMDGAPYLRKVDLKTYFNYAELSAALEKMFSGFTSGKCASNGCPEREMNNAKGLKDIIPTSEYVLTYEDKDGDWMLVGDVPWEMFINSCKRLRIMKGSEATGLGKTSQHLKILPEDLALRLLPKR